MHALQPLFSVRRIDRQGNLHFLIDNNVNHDSFAGFALKQPINAEFFVLCWRSPEILEEEK